MIADEPDGEQVEIAARLSRQHPGWWVHWGRWSRLYWAYPMFNAPRDSHFADKDPDELAARMRQAEMIATRRA